MTRWQHVALALIVILAAGWEFSGVWTAGFVHQDNRWEYAATFRPSPGQWDRALMRWSWFWQTWHTPTARSFHLVNLGLHLVAAGLVAALVRRLGATAIATWIAFIVFLLNPIQAEAAVYLSGRTEEFALIGILGACIALTGRLTPTRIVLGAAAILFGLVGKESAIAVIALIPIVRRRWSWVVPATALMLAVVYLTARARAYAVPDGAWVLLQATAAWRAVCVALTLTGSTIDFDYGGVSLVARIVSALALIALVWIGWTVRAVRPLVAIGLLWMIASIAPRFLVYTPGSPFHERHLYAGMAGFACAAAGCVMPKVSL